jgi:hypothetical protein
MAVLPRGFEVWSLLRENNTNHERGKQNDEEILDKEEGWSK